MKNIIAIMIISLSINSFAQSNKPLVNAFKLSYEYEAVKNYEAAITILNSVYAETSYEINLRLGWLHYLTNKQKESINYYQKSSKIMPASTEPLWGVVTVLSKAENWTEIEKTYLSILKIDAKNTSANYNVALIYYYRKDYINAKKYFDVCLNLAPFNYNYLLMSAWTNYFLGNKNEASILFNKTLLYSTNDKSALEGLGLIK